MSYYKQAGVASGLIRSINQGMSSRVKNAEEFINTRLNNKEFKNANSIATYAYRAIPKKVVTSLRRFAIAEMTKGVLPYIKSGSGSWGARIPSERMDIIISDILENRAKNGVYDGKFGDISANLGVNDSVSVSITVGEQVMRTLKDQGIDSYIVDCYFGIAADVVGQSLDGTSIGELLHGFSDSLNLTQVDTSEASASDTTSFSPSAAAFKIPNALYTRILNANNQGLFVVFAFLPLRDIDQSYYPLYEQGTFAVLPLGQINPD